MNNSKVKISSNLSDSVRFELKDCLHLPIEKIMIGGNFGIKGSLDRAKYIGNQITMCFKEGDESTTISFFSEVISRDDFGAYDYVFLKKYKYSEDSTFGPEKDMLLRNRGIFYLNELENLTIESIDVYGVMVNEFLDRDEDFPEEAKIVTADIDLLLKFNTNQKSFFTFFAKEGNIILNFYDKKRKFNDFIELTKHWGTFSQLKKKYTL